MKKKAIYIKPTVEVIELHDLCNHGLDTSGFNEEEAAKGFSFEVEDEEEETIDYGYHINLWEE